MSNLINRVMGEYPVSISTSLAFQGLFDKHPDSPKNKKKIGDFKQIWINIKTLYRNLHNAVEVKTEKIELTVIMDYVDILKAEMSAIDELMEKEGYTVNYYHMNYDNLERKYPRAFIRGDKTLKQILFTKLFNEVAKLMLVRNFHKNMFIFNGRITPEDKKSSIILTHLALDLFSVTNFNELVLLESHTGKLKERAEWYTKYYQGAELSHIPFREDLIQIFGDNESIRPMPKRTRDAFNLIAIKGKWSQVTTSEKINYTINQSNDLYLKESWKSITKTVKS